MEFTESNLKVLVETEQRSKSNTKRLDELSGQIDAVNRLATAVELLANEQKHQTESTDKLEKNVAELTTKVDAIEKEPGARWKGLVEKVIYLIVAAVIGFLLAKIGLE